MDNASTIAAQADKSHLNDSDAELLSKIVDQVWYVVRQTNSPHLLTTYNELKDLHTRATEGKAD